MAGKSASLQIWVTLPSVREETRAGGKKDFKTQKKKRPIRGLQSGGKTQVLARIVEESEPLPCSGLELVG